MGKLAIGHESANTIANPPSNSTALAFDNNGWPYIIQDDGTKVPLKNSAQWDYYWEDGTDPFNGGANVVTNQVGCGRIGYNADGNLDVQVYVGGATNNFVSRNQLTS